MNVFLNIIDLNIKIDNYPFNELPYNFKPFVGDAKSIDIRYYVNIQDSIKVEGICLFANQQKEIYQSGDTYYYISIFKEPDKTVKCYTVFKHQCDIVNIYIPDMFFDLKFKVDYFMSLMLFDYIIIPFHRMIMHCSVVEYQSSAILFTGKSGMGKSTQSNLWQQYCDANIINGDRGTLKVSEDEIEVFGSPYAGSSEIYKNEHVPVKAIVLLGQDTKNSIVKLDGIRAFKELFPRFSIARWNKVMFNESMNLINSITDKIPIYKLICYPGKEAVDLVRKTIYKEG